MDNTNEKVEQLVNSFVTDLTALVREQALDTVRSALGERTAKPKVQRKRSKPQAKAGGNVSRKRKGKARTAPKKVSVADFLKQNFAGQEVSVAEVSKAYKSKMRDSIADQSVYYALKKLDAPKAGKGKFKVPS